MSAGAVSPLAVPAVAALARYAPGAAAMLNLADNTNLWGSPPAAARAIAAAAAGQASYPTLYGESLAAAVVASVGAPFGIRVEEVVTGGGSDNVLDAAMRAFAGPGRAVAYSAPTFAMVPHFISLAGATPVAVPFAPGGDVDADALVAAQAAVTYVCAPNNPTGTAPSAAAVRRVLEGAPGLVILDEAYADFAGTTWLGEAVAHGRLLVARTMSKAYGLAGVRAGWGVARADVIAALERARGPFTLSAVAEAAAAAALMEDGDWVAAHARLAVETRERLTAALGALGHVALPSAANFLCVPVADAPAMAATLAARGIRVRAFRALPGIGDALRITVGPWTMMERLLDAWRATWA